MMLLEFYEAQKVNFVIVLTKADKLTGQKLEKMFKDTNEKISKFQYASNFIHTTSSKYFFYL